MNNKIVLSKYKGNKLKQQINSFLFKIETMSINIETLKNNIKQFNDLQQLYQTKCVQFMISMSNTDDCLKIMIMKHLIKLFYTIGKEYKFYIIKILQYLQTAPLGYIQKHYNAVNYQPIEDACKILNTAITKPFHSVNSVSGIQTKLLLSQVFGYTSVNIQPNQKSLTTGVAIETILKIQATDTIQPYILDKNPQTYVLDETTGNIYNILQERENNSQVINEINPVRVFAILDASAIQNFTQIQSIYLINCQTTSLKFNYPQSLSQITVTKLKELDLSGCSNLKIISLQDIDSVSLSPFHTFKNITHLFVDSVKFVENGIQAKLKTNLLRNYQNLKVLILRSCSLEKIMIFDFPMPYLEVLSIKFTLQQTLGITIYTDLSHLRKLMSLSTDIPVEIIGNESLKPMNAEFYVNQKPNNFNDQVVKADIAQLQHLHASEQLLDAMQQENDQLIGQLLNQLWSVYTRQIVNQNQYYIIKCMEVIALNFNQALEQLEINSKNDIVQFIQQLLYCLDNTENINQLQDNITKFLSQVFTHIVFKVGIKKGKGYEQFDDILPLSLRLCFQLKINGIDKIQVLYDQSTKQSIDFQQNKIKDDNLGQTYIGIFLGNHEDELFEYKIKLNAIHYYNNVSQVLQIYQPELLQSVTVGDAVSIDLSECKSLQFLCLYQATKVKTQYFQHLPMLKCLNLTGVQYVDENDQQTAIKAQDLRKLNNLEYLYISKCLTEEIMEFNFPLPQLQFVRLLLFDNNLISAVFEMEKCQLNNLRFLQCDANIHIITSKDLPKIQQVKSHNSNNILKCKCKDDKYYYDPEIVIPIVSQNKRLHRIQNELQKETSNDDENKTQLLRFIYHLEKMIQVAPNRFTKYMLLLCQEELLRSGSPMSFQLENEGKIIAMAQLFQSHVYYNEVNTKLQLEIVKFVGKWCGSMLLNINFQRRIYMDWEVLNDIYWFKQNILLDIDVKPQKGFFDILKLQENETIIQQEQLKIDPQMKKTFQSIRLGQDPKKLCILVKQLNEELKEKAQQLVQVLQIDIIMQQFNEDVEIEITDEENDKTRFQLNKDQNYAILLHKPDIHHLQFINITEQLGITYKRVFITQFSINENTKMLYDTIFQRQDLQYLNVKNSSCIKMNNFVNIQTLVLTNLEGVNYKDFYSFTNLNNIKLSGWLNLYFFSDVDKIISVPKSQQNEAYLQDVQRHYMDLLLPILFNMQSLQYVEITYSFLKSELIIDNLPDQIQHLTFFKNDGLTSLKIQDNQSQEGKIKDLQILNFVSYYENEKTFLTLNHPELYKNLLYADCSNEIKIFERINPLL